MNRAGSQSEAAQAAPAEGRRFLTVREAASLLGVSERWLQTALRREPREKGSIPAHRLPTRGRRTYWRFDPDELGAWMHAGCPPVADWQRMQAERGRL